MARWRLRAKHYLSVVGTEFEYKETHSTTGEQVRTVRAVPRFLDPESPKDVNYKDTGDCIVAQGEGSRPRDYIFEGEPTPDMEPLDAEAEAISAKFAKKWSGSGDFTRFDNFGDGLTNKFEELIIKASTNQATAAAAPSSVQTQIDLLIEGNKQLTALVAHLVAKPTETTRRGLTPES